MDVGQQVAMQLGDREVEQRAAGIEVRQREGRDEQRVQLQRAVVTLGREVLAQVPDLLVQAGEDPLGQAIREPREARRRRERAPGVDPVLDAAAGDVARVEPDRHLLDPGPDQPLPGVQKPQLAGLAKGVGQVEPVVELAPVDPPLLVVRQLRAAASPARRRGRP